ncbi:putative reverse transcriptase domain-containing protein [Tanacetum coccineum]
MVEAIDVTLGFNLQGLCVGYGTRFFKSKGGGGGRGVKEKQHGSANVNIVSSIVDEPSTIAPIGTTTPINSSNKDSTKEGNIGTCSTPIGTTFAPNTGSISINVTDSSTTNLNNTDPIHSGPTSYAKLVTREPSRKSMNFRTLFTPAENGVDVVVPVEFIRAISERFANTTYGFFLGKRVAYPVVANYVRSSWGSMEGLDAMLENGPWFIHNNLLILKKLHLNVNLLKEDVGTIPVWVKLHGVPVTAFSEDGLRRSSYARVMIELRADVELKDNIVAAMPKIIRESYYTCNIRVEYEWKPSKCACCKVFGHIQEEYPKNIGTGETKNLKKTSQTPKGISVGEKMGFKPTKQVFQPVSKKSTANTSVNKKKNEEPTKEGTGYSAPWLKPWAKTPPENSRTTPRVAFSCLKPLSPAQMVRENATRRHETLYRVSRTGGLVKLLCFAFFVSSEVSTSRSLLKSAFRADARGRLPGLSSFCVFVGSCVRRGVDCGSRDSSVLPSMISGWLLAVVDKAGLGGSGGCICSGGSIVIACGRLWEGGAGKGSAVFLKTLSKIKFCLFEVLPASK